MFGCFILTSLCVNNYFKAEIFEKNYVKHFVYWACYIRDKAMVSTLKVNLKTNFVFGLVLLDC